MRSVEVVCWQMEQKLAGVEEARREIEAEALRLAGQCDARLARGTGSPGRVMGGLALQTA